MELLNFHIKGWITTWLLLADGKQALLDGVSLGLGERAALGQSVDGVKCGVHECSVVLRMSKEVRTSRQQRQHG